MSRLRAHVYLAILLVAASTSSTSSSGTYWLYVGTYTGHGSQGIYVYRFDATTGETTPIGLAAEAENPSFLAVHPGGRLLYSVNEVDQFEGKPGGAVSAFSVDGKTGKLALLNRVASLGAGPAHLSLDKTGKYVLVANYGGGSVAVFPLDKDGRLGQASAFVQHTGSSVDLGRQRSPHAHQVLTSNDNRFALVADLGLDEVLVYRFDAKKGSLTPNDPKFAKTDPGAGPRHLAFNPDGRFVFVINELQSSLATFAYDSKAGVLHRLQTVSTLPKGFHGQNTDAEIALEAKGRFLYASNRGDDSIAVFSIDHARGTLSLVQVVSAGGKTPRDFAIDPTGQWLFVANQDSNSIVLFRIDPDTGRLAPRQPLLETYAPVCLTFVPAEPWRFYPAIFRGFDSCGLSYSILTWVAFSSFAGKLSAMNRKSKTAGNTIHSSPEPLMCYAELAVPYPLPLAVTRTMSEAAPLSSWKLLAVRVLGKRWSR